MKCRYCNQDCIKLRTCGETRCLNHFMDVNYFPDGSGCSIFTKNKIDKDQYSFCIKTYFDESKKTTIWFSNGKWIKLNNSPDFNPDQNLEEKFKKLLLFI